MRMSRSARLRKSRIKTQSCALSLSPPSPPTVLSFRRRCCNTHAGRLPLALTSIAASKKRKGYRTDESSPWRNVRINPLGTLRLKAAAVDRRIFCVHVSLAHQGPPRRLKTDQVHPANPSSLTPFACLRWAGFPVSSSSFLLAVLVSSPRLLKLRRFL